MDLSPLNGVLVSWVVFGLGGRQFGGEWGGVIQGGVETAGMVIGFDGFKDLLPRGFLGFEYAV